ncbi:hypothetical protein [Bradyrhizobium sp. Ec3.3]|uniref:hypothetical protein n=1 Tax=Bradyrhizobium sp. Ec3.3 TaxID=189753 RepID=UPI00040D738B|nr:hypothetical protein [Bradyrhizobium sp. Ec3.3]
MPILRYFVFVGGALLALLLVVNLALPEGPVGQSIVTSSNEAPLIRIRSDRKLPERVVLDTSQPRVASTAPVNTASVAPQPPAQPNVSPAGEMSAKARVRESFAQFVPTEPKGDAASVKKPVQPKRKVARRSPQPYYYGQPTYYGFGQPTFGRPMRVAQQPHFGLFNTTW